ncbi:MAG: biotin carboxylase N-terminal domain-containing protein [Ilumatobacteraceae bacterium]
MIRSLLVANRGEIARRIMRTARDMGIRCVAVYVDADEHAPFVSEADEAVKLSTGYLDGDAIVAAALAAGADAVHPGYGFLSENAGFAAAVEAGVPILPSSDQPDDPAEADRVGYPLLVKAAAGGGGKGMRVVDRADDLVEAVASARREAASAFGDDRVFMERYVRRSHHVEIQILGDHHGNLVHLGERECSIQRRHQKIVEESPSPVIDAGIRAAMCEAALRLGRAMGYESAGTVEMLVDAVTLEFFFLEVNTRLQVEHPVTEGVTGIDLVRAQLLVAAGEPLHVRQDDIAFSGHAIEVRLYAEDPSNGFLPATGTLAAFEPADAPSVRWDSGVQAGSVVGTLFDPMLAKVVTHAPTRSEAAARLALALERLHIAGVVTNRDFLVAVLRHDAFLAGDTTTDFIDRVHPAPMFAPDDEELLRAATAAALWLQGERRAGAPVWQGLPSGWRNARLPDQQVTFAHGERVVTIRYRSRRDGSFDVNGDRTAQVLCHSSLAIDLALDGRRATFRITRVGDVLHVQSPAGTVALDVVPRFHLPGPESLAGGLVAPMPGTVLHVRVAPGDEVTAGQVLVVLEAMKMEHHIKAPADGRLAEVRVAEGEHVDNGGLLLVFETDEAPA